MLLFIGNLPVYNYFWVRVAIAFKKRQWVRSIKKQEERERAEICLLTNKIFMIKTCYSP